MQKYQVDEGARTVHRKIAEERPAILTPGEFKKYMSNEPPVPSGSVQERGYGALKSSAYRDVSQKLKRRMAQEGSDIAVLRHTKRKCSLWAYLCNLFTDKPADIAYLFEFDLYTTPQNSVLNRMALTDNGIALR